MDYQCGLAIGPGRRKTWEAGALMSGRPPWKKGSATSTGLKDRGKRVRRLVGDGKGH